MPPSRVTVCLLLLFVFSGAPPARSQQPYGWQTSDCKKRHNHTGLLGYFCARGGAPSSLCESYLTFNVRPPYADISSVAALLGADAASIAAANSATSFAPGTKILVPVNCSCTGTSTAAAGRRPAFYYQHSAAYVARSGDTLLIIASRKFQGLSTCQAIEDKSLGGAAPTTLRVGQSVTVPLRCACPSATQAAAGVRFLVSYLVEKFDTMSAIAARFGVDAGSILAANQLKNDSTIYPSTTLLIPVKSRPDILHLGSPAPAASLPPKKSSNRTRVYVGAGVAGAAAAIVAIAVAVLVLKVRRCRSRRATNKDGEGMAPYGVPVNGPSKIEQ